MEGDDESDDGAGVGGEVNEYLGGGDGGGGSSSSSRDGVVVAEALRDASLWRKFEKIGLFENGWPRRQEVDLRLTSVTNKRNRRSAANPHARF